MSQLGPSLAAKRGREVKAIVKPAHPPPRALDMADTARSRGSRVPRLALLIDATTTDLSSSVPGAGCPVREDDCQRVVMVRYDIDHGCPLLTFDNGDAHICHFPH